MSQPSAAAAADGLPDTIAGVLVRMMKELQCPICWQPLTKATKTPCSHTFCRDCITQALQVHGKCPICNYKLNSRRELYASPSIDPIVEEFAELRKAYEEESHQNLSLHVPEHQQGWREEPRADLSQQFPHPTKASPAAEQDAGPSSSSVRSTGNDYATYDSDVTHVTSQEIRQAQETHERRAAASLAAAEEQRQIMASPVVSLDAPCIGTSHVKNALVIQALKALLQRMDGRRASEVSQEMTFLLVPADEQRITSRTVKYLQAVLLGKPIVSEAWVLACREQNTVLGVEPYLVIGDNSHPDDHAPQRARQLLAQGHPRLLEGQKFYLDGAFGRNPSKQELMSLVTLAGGRVVVSADEAVQTICPDEKPKLNHTHPHDDDGQCHGRGVSFMWILDCVSAYREFDRCPYYVK